LILPSSPEPAFSEVNYENVEPQRVAQSNDLKKKKSHPHKKPVGEEEQYCTQSLERRLSSVQIEQVQKEILERISKETLGYLLEEVLPTMPDSNHKTYGKKDIFLVYLWALLYNPSYRQVQEKFSFPKSNWMQVQSSIRRPLEAWANNQISSNIGTVDERLDLNGEAPSFFSKVTWWGTHEHFRIWEKQANLGKTGRSDKYKCRSAVAYFFMMKADEVIYLRIPFYLYFFFLKKIHYIGFDF